MIDWLMENPLRMIVVMVIIFIILAILIHIAFPAIKDYGHLSLAPLCGASFLFEL